MSSSPTNWEHLFKPVYCSICSQEISVQMCDCGLDMEEIVEDEFDDYEGDERSC